MPNRIEGYIGCPKCGTALFRLEAEQLSPGVFGHVTVPLGDTAIGAKTCPVDDCGANLERLSAPE